MRLHGHGYVVEVSLAAEETNEYGFVVDYNELKVFDEYVQSRCDHRHLNDVFTFQPTAENLARHFYEWISGTQSWPLLAVRVSETGKTWAEYRLPEKVKAVNLHVQLETEIQVGCSQPTFDEIRKLFRDDCQPFRY